MLRNFTRLFGIRVLTLFVAGLFLAGVTTYIPADVFGEFSLMLSAIQIISGGILSFGNHALLRYGREEFSTTEMITSALKTRLIIHVSLLTPVAIIIWFAYPLFEEALPFSPQGRLLTLLGLAIMPLTEMGAFAAQSTGVFSGYGLAPLISRMAQLLGLTGIVLLGAVSWVWLFVSALVGYVLAATINWTRLPHGTVPGALRSTHEVRLFLRFNWSLPFATLSMALFFGMDLWFMEAFHGAEQTGIYAWAFNISLIATALLAPLGAVMAPQAIDQLTTGDDRGLGRMLNGGAGLVAAAIALVPIGAATVFLFLQHFDLAGYRDAVAPALILICAVAFQIGTNMWEPITLAAERCVGKAVVVHIGMALINAVGNWNLIPSYGGTGAACATGVAYLFGAVALLYVLKREIRTAKPVVVPYQLGVLGLVMLSVVILSQLFAPLLFIETCIATTVALIVSCRFLGSFDELIAVAQMTGRKDSRLLSMIALAFTRSGKRSSGEA